MFMTIAIPQLGFFVCLIKKMQKYLADSGIVRIFAGVNFMSYKQLW